MNIPNWNIHGIVPPIRPEYSGSDPDRSPYSVDLRIFVERFGMTAERRGILRGLLSLRKVLASAGITHGFQWIDGSFLEDVERTRGRAPGDVDVVTFAELGDEANQRRLVDKFPALFNNLKLKSMYRVDHYFVNLSKQQSIETVRRVSYWYSMWSHRRTDQRWKGFVQVTLNPDDDAAANAYLDTTDENAVAPGAVP